jgi:hypothetical protein
MNSNLNSKMVGLTAQVANDFAMASLFETMITILIITIAALYLLRRGWLVFHPTAKKNCGGCSGCTRESNASTPHSESLIQIGKTRK